MSGMYFGHIGMIEKNGNYYIIQGYMAVSQNRGIPI